MIEKIYLAAATPGEGGGAGEYQEGIYNPALNPLVGTGEGLDIINLFLGNIIAILLIVGVIVAFIFLVVGAIQWMTAGGDKAALESARGKVVSAIVGLIALFAVFAIIKLIGSFFGIEALENLFFDISPYLIK
ncbi:MAG TPA: hypothetical protein VMY36_02905 [Patescibacteria group bacterium]|nr:hypothetical protein [Patescibacteria group bacterium]